jgi:hypothetical protein
MDSETTGAWSTEMAEDALHECILKLPSGLRLCFSADGKAYTVPARTDTADIEQTLDEVGGWLQTQRVRLFEKEPPRRTFKPGSPEYHYANVQYWLDAYEDQHPYLSSEMPKRQRREVDRERTKELLDRFFPKRS